MQSSTSPQTSRRRIFALLLAFGALLVLLIATTMTTQAFVISQTHQTLDDFAAGRFYWTGLLDIPRDPPQEDIQSVQLMPAGLVTKWGQDRSLPNRLRELAAVVAGDHVVVMGGYGGPSGGGNSYRDEVFVSALNQNDLLGPWQEQTGHPLPQAMAGAAAVSYPNPNDPNQSWIYLFGGFAGAAGGGFTETYRTTLDHSTGAISDWTPTEPLSIPTYYLDAVALNDYVYVLGGYTTDYVTCDFYPQCALQHVYYAAINSSNGNLGPWQTGAFLPEPLQHHTAIGYSDESVSTLYVIGGRLEGKWVPTASTHHVYFANVNPDGSLSPWGPLAGKTFGNLPKPLYAHAGALLNGAILVTGGVATQDIGDVITNTVMAALIDPGQADFRLYNWCGDPPLPGCEIGAWATGQALSQYRTFHEIVATKRYVFTLGGVEKDPGTGQVTDPTDSVYWGSVEDDTEAIYAPHGYYVSPPFELEVGSEIERLTWNVSMPFPDDQGADFRYRIKREQATEWESWAGPIASISGTQSIDFTPPLTEVRLLQYRIDFTTAISKSSPRLNDVTVYYDIPDPEVQVRKDTGSTVSATVGTVLEYTINYTNNGWYTATGVILTETLPDNTTYQAGDDPWQAIGGNRYRLQVGDVARQANGLATMRVKVGKPASIEVERLTNTVEIDYPPMIDLLDNIVVDPVPDNNFYQFSNPLEVYVVALDKQAEPPARSAVEPGSRITYTIAYTNQGRIQANPAVISDTFTPDTNLTVVSAIPPASSGNNVWNLGALNSGESGSIELIVELDDIVYPKDWIVTNQANLSSPQGPIQESQLVTHTIQNHDPNLKYVDLVVKDVRWEPTTIYTDTTVTFYATIASEGDIDADTEFWLELYTKPAPSDPPEKAADHDQGYCLSNCTTTRPDYVLLISNLPTGTEFEVTFDAEVVFPQAGLFDIYAQIDVAWDPPGLPDYHPYWGVYAEASEDNNVLQETLTVLSSSGPGPGKTCPGICIPFIAKNSSH